MDFLIFKALIPIVVNIRVNCANNNKSKEKKKRKKENIFYVI